MIIDLFTSGQRIRGELKVFKFDWNFHESLKLLIGLHFILMFSVRSAGHLTSTDASTGSFYRPAKK